MKKLLTFLFLLLTSQIIFAQTKIAEARINDDGSEGAKKLIESLKKDPESKGFIFIHVGKTRERLGDIRGLIGGIKRRIEYELGKTNSKRISFAMIEAKSNQYGESTLYKEFWIIPKGKKKPKVKEVKIKLDNLKTKYFYAEMCGECYAFSPSPLKSDGHFIPFAEALNKNPDYQGLIIVRSNSIEWGDSLKKEFVREYKLNEKQIDVELGTDLGIVHPVFEFYIVPKIK